MSLKKLGEIMLSMRTMGAYFVLMSGAMLFTSYELFKHTPELPLQTLIGCYGIPAVGILTGVLMMLFPKKTERLISLILFTKRQRGEE